MSARRGATTLSGILALDKPAGLTSHDVVNRVRHITGERRVGHTGTLDPAATGLLVVLVGPAARLAPYFTAADKVYQARIIFGTETDTDDAEGTVTSIAHVPDEVADPSFATSIVTSLMGTHEQVPPAYSAVKRGGVTAHVAARKGQALDLEARTIEITGARLLGVECMGECAWDVEVTVSKGTYVRAIARDLGRSMSTAAHLGALRRTRSGALAVADAHTLEQLAEAPDPRTLFADPATAIGLSIVEVDTDSACRVAVGSSLDGDAKGLVAVMHDGVLLGVYAGGDGVLKPQAVIPGGVTGGAR